MKLKELQSLMQVNAEAGRRIRNMSAVANKFSLFMQDIAVFDDPKVDLEQYPTGPHLASRLLFTVSNALGPHAMIHKLSCTVAAIAWQQAPLRSFNLRHI